MARLLGRVPRQPVQEIETGGPLPFTSVQCLVQYAARRVDQKAGIPLRVPEVAVRAPNLPKQLAESSDDRLVVPAGLFCLCNIHDIHHDYR
jgi:hypothetical protein